MKRFRRPSDSPASNRGFQRGLRFWLWLLVPLLSIAGTVWAVNVIADRITGR